MADSIITRKRLQVVNNLNLSGNAANMINNNFYTLGDYISIVDNLTGIVATGLSGFGVGGILNADLNVNTYKIKSTGNNFLSFYSPRSIILSGSIGSVNEDGRIITGGINNINLSLGDTIPMYGLDYYNTHGVRCAAIGGWNNRITSGTYNAVVVGDNNIINGAHSSLVGGTSNIIETGCSDTFVNGYGNYLDNTPISICVGASNQAVGDMAGINALFGTFNHVDGDYNIIAGYSNNIIGNANVAFGAFNAITTSHATAIGANCVVQNIGELAQGSLSYALGYPTPMQIGRLTLCGTTQDVTLTSIPSDNFNAGFTIFTNAIYKLDIDVVAGGTTASVWSYDGCAYILDGNIFTSGLWTTLLNTQNLPTPFISGDYYNKLLQVFVQGRESTVTWMAKVEYTVNYLQQI